MATWQLITGEYPPQTGGVSDYSQLVARALTAAGDKVDVWVPESKSPEAQDSGVSLHRLPGHFGPKGLAAVNRDLRREGRLLIQYVPHAFGGKAMNLAFCAWLFSQRDKIPIDVMFHEVAMGLKRGQPWRHKFLAVANYLMAFFVVRAARRVFVSIPAWAETLRPMLPVTASVTWLPVPSSIAVEADDRNAASRRRHYAANGVPLLGHFGTYSTPIADLLAEVLPQLLDSRRDARLLLLGRRGDAFRHRIGDLRPDLLRRIYAPPAFRPREISQQLSLCDVMVQPYPDGITSRRTSAMAALAHGRPVVTTTGHLTEPLWQASQAVALAPVRRLDLLSEMACALLADEHERKRIAIAGKELYEERFDLKHTISALRDMRGGINARALPV